MSTEGAPEIASIQDRYLFSLSQLSSAFGPSRETVVKKLRLAEISPRGKRKGYDVYHVGDAAVAILADASPSYDGSADPDNMPPKERLDWYKSENERFKAEKEQGLLLSVESVSAEWAKILRAVGSTLDAISDKLEQKFQVEPDLLCEIETVIDSARLTLASKLENNNIEPNELDGDDDAE